MRAAAAVPWIVLFLLNVALNWALFLPGENIYQGSIEGGYASMTRWIAQHPDPFGWNPLQYTGLPAHRLYLPAIHYLAASLSWAAGIEAAYAYRLLGSFFLCLIPVTFGLLVWYFTRSRWWALAAGLALTFLSPNYGLIEQIMSDRGMVQSPWRVHVHYRYGEAPHNIGLSLMPLALIALHRAGVRRTPRSIVLAAALLAVVPLTNLLAAFALAFACSVLILSYFHRDGFRVWPALACGFLAYGMALFWLTPEFLAAISGNWAQDALGFKLRAVQVLYIVLLAAGLVILRFFVFRSAAHSYLGFIAVVLSGYALVVLLKYRAGQDVIPEAHRYSLEMEIFLILLILECSRLLVLSGNHAKRAAGALLIAALVLLCGKDAWRYARKKTADWRPVPRESVNAFQVARRLAALEPQGRVFVTGALRFRWNSWFDLPQATGNFETALRNRVPVHYQYQIVSGESSAAGEDGRDALKQLIALGVEYVVLHRPESAAYYKDFRNPVKFDGLLQNVWERNGDVIYRVPFRSLAHIVREEEFPAASPKEFLKDFAEALSDDSRPLLRTTWESPNRLAIEGDFPANRAVAALISYDPGWKAVQNGEPVRIERTPVGCLKLHSQPTSPGKITLEYGGEPAHKEYAALSGLVWIASLGMCLRAGRSAGRKGAGTSANLSASASSGLFTSWYH